MGKPFKKELDNITSTIEWANKLFIDDFRNALLFDRKLPLYIVGSGGSLSACHFAAMLYQRNGMIAKAVTPLELTYAKPSLKNSNILFISASGRNTDILFAYGMAVDAEPNHIYICTMKEGSPLAQKAKNNQLTTVFEFPNPAGKDGFLATNSLVAFFSLLGRAMSFQNVQITNPDLETYFGQLDVFLSKVSPEFTFNVLSIGWGQAVGLDIESKLAEAALADVLVTDWRNFGHGRHHWFDKRIANSALIAIITPEEKELAKKTLSFLPKEIPVLELESNSSGPSGTIDLLIKSFYFIEKIGAMQNIDPGRPGVPDFGSKLYHLRYQSFYKKINNKENAYKTAIERKANIAVFDQLPEHDKSYWLTAYNTFTKELSNRPFGSIIFDYDGTICSMANRRTGLDVETSQALHRLLEQNVVIGIATGRGKSARQDLQNAIDKKYWSSIIVGYYNCSSIGFLTDNDLPNLTAPQNPKLAEIFSKLKKQQFLFSINPELKPQQIVIEISDNSQWERVRISIIHFILGLNIANIQILESSHSMDIIDQTITNKLNILPICSDLALERGLSEDCLCIGDKGKWPGNDYQLLSHPYSLSVDEVSTLPGSCWNLSKTGIKNLEATKHYLSLLNHTPNGPEIKLK